MTMNRTEQYNQAVAARDGADRPDRPKLSPRREQFLRARHANLKAHGRLDEFGDDERAELAEAGIVLDEPDREPTRAELEQIADGLEVKYTANLSDDKLRERIDEAIAGRQSDDGVEG